jgi:hypothetical protein
MKPKTARLLANAFSDLIRVLGIDMKEAASGFLAAPLDESWKDFVRRAQRNGLARQLEELPEPSEEEVADALATAERTKSMTQVLRQALKARLRALPRKRGGPVRKILVRDELRVCAEFQALQDDYDARKAVQYIARRRGVSERTIYRILAKHELTKPRRTKKTLVK